MSETQKEKAAAMHEATDIGTLIERVEKAEGPDLNLEADILNALFKPVPDEWRRLSFSPTGSLDAAVALAEKVGDAQILLDEAMDDLSTTGWHPDKPFGPQLARYLLLALLRSLQEKSHG